MIPTWLPNLYKLDLMNSEACGDTYRPSVNDDNLRTILRESKNLQILCIVYVEVKSGSEGSEREGVNVGIE